MAEPLVNGLDPRKKLYSALVGSSDKELAGQVKQFSYNKFNGLLDNNDFVRDLFMDISERGIVLDPKNPNASKDPVEFANAFIYRDPVAKPQPQVQAAPAMQMAAPVEEETYTPPPQPLIGSSKYNNRVRELNPFPTPTLGETFGGVPAVFETREQRRQEEMSPVFKAHNLAFVDNPFSPNPYNAPVAEEQRKAQRQFAKATKQEKEAALRGGTGFELQQKQANERREATKKLKDFGSSLGVTFDNMINKVKAAEAMFGAKQRALLTFGEKGKKAEEQEKKVKQQVLGYLDQVDQDFAAKQAEYNIEGNIYDVISKGQLDRLPEAFAYNLAQIGINALGAGTTGGYSTFAQVVPDMYKAGVEEIARKTNTTPEEVIASGKDKEVIAYTAGAISGGIDYFSSGLLGKAMKSKGAYKFLRDLALDKIGKTKWKQAAASAAALGGVANIEGLTEGAQGLIEVAAPQVASAKSFKEARENIYGELQKPSTQRRLASDIVGGAAGGGGLVAGGRGLERLAQGDFTYGDVRKTIQRADMDIVQTDNKIQERNKIAQAMEEAVKGNPEAEGQIREQYQKRVNEAAPTDEEVLNAYEGLAALPETEEKNTIRENLEAYMAEKGIQPEAAGMDAGLGEGLRVTAPSEEAPVIQTVNPKFPLPQPPAPTEEQIADDIQNKRFATFTYRDESEVPEQFKDKISSTGEVNGERFVRVTLPQSVADYELSRVSPEAAPEVTPTETAPLEEVPAEEAIQEDEDLASLGQTISGLEQAPVEEAAPEVAPKVVPEQVVPEEEVAPEVAPAAPAPKGRKKAAPVTPAPAAPKKEEAPKPEPKKEEPKGKKYPIEDKGKWYADEDYEKRGGKLVTMTPDEFLAQSKPLEIDEEARDNIDTLKEQIEKGGKLDPLAIYSTDKTKSSSTDGRHRAIAAKELGIKEVPVLDFTTAETKPSSTTPQEGTIVEIAPQREGGSPRKMVFKDGEWKQNVGGDIVKVGPSVQQQAQEMFGGKAEVKPAETKAEAEFTSKQESSASQEFDGMKKPSKIKTKSFDGKHGKGAFERMKNITDNFEDIMDGMSGKIKQDCL